MAPFFTLRQTKFHTAVLFQSCSAVQAPKAAAFSPPPPIPALLLCGSVTHLPLVLD